MDKRLLESLIFYGLTENEAKIYLSLVRRLEASVFDIAKDTGIPRATVYITLEKMKDLYLVSSLKKNNVLHYTPESTTRLKTLLEEKQKKIEDIIPELNALIDTDREKPQTHIYVGGEGVKLVLEDILETMKNEKIHTLYAASHPEILEYFPKYFPNWLKRRETLGIHTKLIMPESEKTAEVFESNALRETRYMPNRFPFNATVEIYGKKMALFSLKDNEVYSIIIESKPAVEIFKQFFLFAWEHAGE